MDIWILSEINYNAITLTVNSPSALTPPRYDFPFTHAEVYMFIRHFTIKYCDTETKVITTANEEQENINKSQWETNLATGMVFSRLK